MPLIPAKTPKFINALFPNYIWHINTLEKVIYLTFDDGPTPKITRYTLDVLAKFNAKATFFCIGANIKKYPNIFKEIIKEKHTIGNHTQHHLKGWSTKTTDYLLDIKTCKTTINSQLINNSFIDTNLLRPPYGKITPKQGKILRAEGYKIVMWDILSFDWDTSVTPQHCLQHVISNAKEGSIIVFHDSIKASKNMQYALPRVLKFFTERGYNFKALNLK